MKTYVILRRGGWPDGGELEKAAARSSDVGDNEMSDDIRWIRSYVMAEESGGLGTVCIYQASSPEKIRRARIACGPACHGDHRGRGHRRGAAGPRARGSLGT